MLASNFLAFYVQTTHHGRDKQKNKNKKSP
jgi:hypothetical protein